MILKRCFLSSTLARIFGVDRDATRNLRNREMIWEKRFAIIIGQTRMYVSSVLALFYLHSRAQSKKTEDSSR